MKFLASAFVILACLLIVSGFRKVIYGSGQPAAFSNLDNGEKAEVLLKIVGGVALLYAISWMPGA